MEEDLFRQRMMKGALGFSERPQRKAEEIPSAGLDFFKKKSEADMAPTGTCRECGREKTQSIGKGLCWKCRQAAIADGTYDVAVPNPLLPPKETPEENHQQLDLSPPVAAQSGIDVLLEGSGHPIEVPHELLHRMEQAGIWPADVILLIEMLLDGRLRRVL